MQINCKLNRRFFIKRQAKSNATLAVDSARLNQGPPKMPQGAQKTLQEPKNTVGKPSPRNPSNNCYIYLLVNEQNKGGVIPTS